MPLPESERLYSDDEIAALLEQAQSLGFSLEQGSELEHLVNYRRVNAPASQATHETTTSTLTPEGALRPAFWRIT